MRNPVLTLKEVCFGGRAQSFLILVGGCVLPFALHVPPDVHRHLAMEAAESGGSLNCIASAKLAH